MIKKFRDFFIILKKNSPEFINKFNPVRNEFLEIRLLSSSLAYSTLLSLIPFLVLVLAAFQYIGGLEHLYPKIETLVLSYLKEATGSTATKVIRRVINRIDHKALGFSGALFLFFTTMGLIRNMDFAFNRIWKIRSTSQGLKRIGLYSLIIMSIPMGLAFFVGTKSLIYINDGLLTFQHNFLLALFSCLALCLLYKIIPATKVNWKPAIISSLLSGLGLWIIQKSFLWASLKIFRENKVYGTMASLPIFLIWLMVVWYTVLLVVSLCAFLQQKTLKRP
jgi:membrane protein